MNIQKIIKILLYISIIYYVYNNPVKLFVNFRKLTFKNNNNLISLFEKISNNNLKNLQKCTHSKIIIQKNPANISKIYNKNYTNYHKIDYVTIKQNQNMFQSINTVFNITNCEYIIYIDNTCTFIDIDKNIDTIIDQAGDVDLIISKSRLTNSINLNIIIIRKSNWSLYKLKQLYWAESINDKIILDQVSTSYTPLNFDKIYKDINKGYPCRLQNICIFNEDSLYSYRSSFTRPHTFLKNIINIQTYPWIDLPNHSHISTRWDKDQKINVNLNCITKVIFQTMETTLLPNEMCEAINKWKELNPEYQHIYFTSLDCRKFIKQYFPSYVYKAYNTILPGAFKADLWRCCVLYIYGGIYTDSRTVPCMSLKKLIDKTDTFIIPRDRWRSWLWNGFICSRPKHPILKSIITNICNSISNKEYMENPLDITGPSCVAKVVNTFLNNNKTSFFRCKTHSNGIKILNFKATFLKDHYITYNNSNVFKTKCKVSDKTFSVITGKEKYDNAWFNKRIYNII